MRADAAVSKELAQELEGIAAEFEADLQYYQQAEECNSPPSWGPMLPLGSMML